MTPPPKYDTCCGTPLVGTILFYKCEYFCVRCGGTYGMFSAPGRKTWTPELDAELARNRAWFAKAAEGARPQGQSVVGDEAIANAQAWQRILALMPTGEQQ